jgi:putative SOS response-associated peptidase YedK
MPMILTTEEERETWLTAPWNDARKLHGPLPDGSAGRRQAVVLMRRALANPRES